MAKTFSHKLGTSRAGDGTRLWLEGKRLADHGFSRGTLIERVWGEGKLILMTTTPKHWDTLPRNERGRVAGTEGRPIVDITGAQVAETFPGGVVSVTWSQGRCVVVAEE